MSKTPYEIRLELLKMAQDQLNQRYYQKANFIQQNAAVKNEQVSLVEIPEFPTTKEILTEADILKTFVDKVY
jgi:hypothetical protein